MNVNEKVLTTISGPRAEAYIDLAESTSMDIWAVITDRTVFFVGDRITTGIRNRIREHFREY